VTEFCNLMSCCLAGWS